VRQFRPWSLVEKFPFLARFRLVEMMVTFVRSPERGHNNQTEDRKGHPAL
jgi:hypothetical protein